MRTNANGCERTLWFCLGVLALLTLGVCLLDGCQSEAPGKTMSAADSIRAVQKHEDAVRAEANAPGPSAQDEQQIDRNLAAWWAEEQADWWAKDQQELADHANLQSGQRVATAEPSAPRINVSAVGNSIGGPVGEMNSGRKRATIALNGHASHHGSVQVPPDASSASDRFYSRSIVAGTQGN